MNTVARAVESIFVTHSEPNKKEFDLREITCWRGARLDRGGDDRPESVRPRLRPLHERGQRHACRELEREFLTPNRGGT